MNLQEMKSPIGAMRVITAISVVVLLIMYYITDIHDLFLTSSIVLSILALFNLIGAYVTKNAGLIKYTAPLFIGMVCGTIGDFLMAGKFSIIGVTLIDGILFFSIGHIFYLIGLRRKSPLLIQENESQKVIMKPNLLLWIVFAIGGVALVLGTAYNPAEMVIVIGGIFYITLLSSVLGFAATKWRANLPRPYAMLLFLGFALFLFSDWGIAVNSLTVPGFMHAYIVGGTYIVGQLLIHLSTWFVSNEERV
ncbi:MAG: lysoplasmalogenase family protein [Candidatus Thorarchaeota archaeon]